MTPINIKIMLKLLIVLLFVIKINTESENNFKMRFTSKRKLLGKQHAGATHRLPSNKERLDLAYLVTGSTLRSSVVGREEFQPKKISGGSKRYKSSLLKDYTEEEVNSTPLTGRIQREKLLHESHLNTISHQNLPEQEFIPLIRTKSKLLNLISSVKPLKTRYKFRQQGSLTRTKAERSKLVSVNMHNTDKVDELPCNLPERVIEEGNSAEQSKNYDDSFEISKFKSDARVDTHKECLANPKKGTIQNNKPSALIDPEEGDQTVSLIFSLIDLNTLRPRTRFTENKFVKSVMTRDTHQCSTNAVSRKSISHNLAGTEKNSGVTTDQSKQSKIKGAGSIENSNLLQHQNCQHQKSSFTVQPWPKLKPKRSLPQISLTTPHVPEKSIQNNMRAETTFLTNPLPYSSSILSSTGQKLQVSSAALDTGGSTRQNVHTPSASISSPYGQNLHTTSASISGPYGQNVHTPSASIPLDPSGQNVHTSSAALSQMSIGKGSSNVLQGISPPSHPNAPPKTSSPSKNQEELGLFGKNLLHAPLVTSELGGGIVTSPQGQLVQSNPVRTNSINSISLLTTLVNLNSARSEINGLTNHPYVEYQVTSSVDQPKFPPESNTQNSALVNSNGDISIINNTDVNISSNLTHDSIMLNAMEREVNKPLANDGIENKFTEIAGSPIQGSTFSNIPRDENTICVHHIELNPPIPQILNEVKPNLGAVGVGTLVAETTNSVFPFCLEDGNPTTTGSSSTCEQTSSTTCENTEQTESPDCQMSFSPPPAAVFSHEIEFIETLFNDQVSGASPGMCDSSPTTCDTEPPPCETLPSCLVPLLTLPTSKTEKPIQPAKGNGQSECGESSSTTCTPPTTCDTKPPSCETLPSCLVPLLTLPTSETQKPIQPAKGNDQSECGSSSCSNYMFVSPKPTTKELAKGFERPEVTCRSSSTTISATEPAVSIQAAMDANANQQAMGNNQLQGTAEVGPFTTVEAALNQYVLLGHLMSMSKLNIPETVSDGSLEVHFSESVGNARKCLGDLSRLFSNLATKKCS